MAETRTRKTSRTRAGGLSKGALLDLYAGMVLVRRAEERLSALFAANEIPGFIHSSIGQEAVPVGVAAALGPEDTVASNHRGHGHTLAKGVDPERFFCELLGRAEGVCGGHGGSMHVADLGVGMLGANGIVGAGIALATGSGLAHATLGNGRVAVAFFGDGALAEGVLHESLNLAALWRLPVLYVCENNGWAEFSPSAAQIAFDIPALAGAYGLAVERVDGSDVEAVAGAAARLVRGARDGRPGFLECATFRAHGHYEGDPQAYRDEAERSLPAARDPLAVGRKRLRARGVRAAEIDAVEAGIERRIEAAVAAARQGSAPSFEAARTAVYAD